MEFFENFGTLEFEANVVYRVSSRKSQDYTGKEKILFPSFEKLKKEIHPLKQTPGHNGVSPS